MCCAAEESGIPAIRCERAEIGKMRLFMCPVKSVRPTFAYHANIEQEKRAKV